MDSIFCNVNNWEGALCKSLIIVEIHAEDEAPSGARPLTFCLRAWCTLPLTHEASAIRLTSVVAEDTSLLSPDAPISELASTVRTDDVFRDPYCGITTGMVKAMGILCRCVGETSPTHTSCMGTCAPQLFSNGGQIPSYLPAVFGLRLAHKCLATGEKMAGSSLRRTCASGDPARQRAPVRDLDPRNARPPSLTESSAGS